MKYERSTTQGRWRSILLAFGAADNSLSGRNAPCPVCGGKDRFRFLDTDGSGSWVCNQCGKGDGMHLVQNMLGLDFKTAVSKVREKLPDATVSAPAKPRDALPRLREMWKQSRPLCEEPADPVVRYLKRRDVWSSPSKELRFLPAAPYYHNGDKTGSHPAMLALVRDKDGTPTTLHITYLDEEGNKADVPSPKKVISAMGEGAHIELFDDGHDGVLDIAEGIETALAVRQLRDASVYATISAQGMRDFVVPPGVKHLHIWGDSDENFTGQQAAYTLANRVAIAGGVAVYVHISLELGTDWADREA